MINFPTNPQEGTDYLVNNRIFIWNGVGFIPKPSSGGSSGHTIKDSTTSFTNRDGLKFTGNVTITDDSVGGNTVVNVPISSTSEDRGYALSDMISNITTGSKLVETITRAYTLIDVRASLSVAATGSLFTINIKKNGTSIFTTKLTFDSAETTTVTALAPYVFTTPTVAFAVGDTLEILVDSIGAVVAGTGLIVFLTINR